MGAYYDEIEIEDMDWDEAKGVFHFPCPCGDRFEISRTQLANYEDVATCPGCSLIIRVVYDPVSNALYHTSTGLNLIGGKFGVNIDIVYVAVVNSFSLTLRTTQTRTRHQTLNQIRIRVRNRLHRTLRARSMSRAALRTTLSRTHLRSCTFQNLLPLQRGSKRQTW